MLATLRGRVRQVAGDHCILEVNGVGYEVLLPLTALEKLSRVDGEVLLYTYLHHKDDTMALYGFLDPEEKALFTQVITVSGIGPKTALAILSVLSPAHFRRAILTEDTGTLRQVPGIGLKSAQRLILELKSRLSKELKKDGEAAGVELPFSDAVAALEALGYSSWTAAGAVEKVWRENPDSTVPELVREALKRLAREE
ncbi:MAG: Holliday junction branch migration protein RuvA [Firmicutes bacterium]|nr:Holliday junction branch migration protein RuvA [Bacillota bacterium]